MLPPWFLRVVEKKAGAAFTKAYKIVFAHAAAVDDDLDAERQDELEEALYLVRELRRQVVGLDALRVEAGDRMNAIHHVEEAMSVFDEIAASLRFRIGDDGQPEAPIYSDDVERVAARVKVLPPSGDHSFYHDNYRQRWGRADTEGREVIFEELLDVLYRSEQHSAVMQSQVKLLEQTVTTVMHAARPGVFGACEESHELDTAAMLMLGRAVADRLSSDDACFYMLAGDGIETGEASEVMENTRLWTKPDDDEWPDNVCEFEWGLLIPLEKVYGETTSDPEGDVGDVLHDFWLQATTEGHIVQGLGCLGSEVQISLVRGGGL